jgi:hypothetical protein
MTLWETNMPWALMNTEMLHGLSDGPPDGLPSKIGHQITTRPDELDPRKQRPDVRVMRRPKH